MAKKKEKVSLDELYTPEEVAAYFGWTVGTVHSKISERKLGSKKIGGRVYCTVEHIQQYIEMHSEDRPAEY